MKQRNPEKLLSVVDLFGTFSVRNNQWFHCYCRPEVEEVILFSFPFFQSFSNAKKFSYVDNFLSFFFWLFFIYTERPCVTQFTHNLHNHFFFHFSPIIHYGFFGMRRRFLLKSIRQILLMKSKASFAATLFIFSYLILEFKKVKLC